MLQFQARPHSALDSSLNVYLQLGVERRVKRSKITGKRFLRKTYVLFAIVDQQQQQTPAYVVPVKKKKLGVKKDIVQK